VHSHIVLFINIYDKIIKGKFSQGIYIKNGKCAQTPKTAIRALENFSLIRNQSTFAFDISSVQGNEDSHVIELSYWV